MTDSRLSGVDHAWLRMDSPVNPMVITGFFAFDAPLDPERLRAVVADRLLAFPRFAQRVVDEGSSHRWQDVEVDLDRHILHDRIPEPADDAAFQDFVGELITRRLDPERPLWRMTVLENHPRGSALFFHFHHALADGVALMKVLLSLCDREGEPMRTGSAGAGTLGGGLLRQVRGLLRSPQQDASAAIEAAKGLLSGGLDLIAHPSHALHAIEGGAPWAGALQRLTTLPPDPHTLLKRPLEGRKQAVWSAPMPLSELKAVGRRHGVTLNDVVLTALVGGLRETMRDQHVPPDAVRAMIPVNLRPPGGPPRLGNYFGFAIPSLPVGQADRLARLHGVRAEMARIKDSVEPAISFALLQALGLAGPGVEERVLRFFGAKSSLVMTNVPGPAERLDLAGESIAEMMFWVPQGGDLGLGLSVLSYAGHVRVGVVADRGVLPDPGALLARVEDELRALA